ncbi:uncharacterized protein LOC131604205 [Vicia villosa]|uniref:uncharacterized protein LOC131604205 n=1 Tax=Vicia villosa TaxID=3911 RepID=UPI00273C151A|nr:uncharacterized protein LOC131604205 [Vicia villosa]
MLLQKSSLKWLKEGDSNSGFFHKVMKNRRRHNHIGPICASGSMVESVEEVREEVFKHFGDKFIEAEKDRPVLEGISFSSISREEAMDIEKPFLECKIKEAVWECGDSKSPGPDGYSFLFIKKCWSFIKEDFINFFNYFYLGRPIAKAHLLSGMLIQGGGEAFGGEKGVLIISLCQSAFVPGRYLLDGVVVANEAVDYARKEGKVCILFKVDFEKAYDKEFEVNRGLKQGDPLSHFLFVLVAEGLSGLVKKSIEVGDFQSFKINGNCPVDMLQFADDTLIVGESNWKHVWALRAVLRAFELVSDLGINYHKSKLIGINSNHHFLEAVSQFFSCKLEDSNFYFLGIPIGFNPRKEATWIPLLSKLKNRLEGFSVHNGFSTLFWEAIWLCDFTLKDLFPDLYVISRLKFVSVAAMGGWNDGMWSWGDFGIFEVEVEEFCLEEVNADFKGKVVGFRGWLEGKDSVVWNNPEDKVFSVASCYEVYNKLRFSYGPPNRNDGAFGLLWKLEAPFKFKAFGWRLFLNRLSVKDLLKIQSISISLEDSKCLFCGFCLETCNHLFFSCLVVKNIWSEIAFWVGKGDTVDDECLSNFMD